MRNLVYISYTATTSGNAGMLCDIHEAISYFGLHNSATGAEPKDSLGRIIQWLQSKLVNTAIKVAKFIYNGIVTAENLIEKAGRGRG